MTKRDVARLSCRVLSLYSLIFFFASLSTIISIFRPAMRGSEFAPLWPLTLISPALLLLSSVSLWFGAGGLSARIIAGTDSSESPSGTSPETLQRIAFSVAGIFVLLGAVTSLRNVIEQIRMQILHMYYSENVLALVMYSVELVIRLALGAWLIMGSEKFRRLLQRLLQKAKPLVRRDW